MNEISKKNYDEAAAILEMAVKNMEAMFGGDLSASYMVAGMLIRRACLPYKATMSEADATKAAEHAVKVGITGQPQPIG